MVQGWRVPNDEASVEIPAKLLRHLEPGMALSATLQATERDSYILSGKAVTDLDALAQMDIPGHETCVEVGRVRKDGAGEPATG